MDRKGSLVKGDFEKEELVLSSRDGTYVLRVIPERSLVTGWKVGDWEVLYRPVLTNNLFRAGLPVMLPNFSSLEGDKTFKETGTKLPHHGFGRNKKWTVDKKSGDSVTFYLEDDEETKAMYPFSFKFLVTVTLDQTGDLIYQLSMENKDEKKSLPVQPGLHPYFTCPQEVKKEIKTSNIDGFDAKKFEWTTKDKTPDNTYDFCKKASFTIPGYGEVTMSEEPASDGKFYLQKLQVWSEQSEAPDHDFVCFEPVVWGANGLNEASHRINVPPKNTITLNIRFAAQKH